MENYREKRLERRLTTQRNTAIVIAVILLLSIIGNVILFTRSSRMSDMNDELQAEKDLVVSENKKITESNRQYRATIEEINRKVEELEQRAADLENEIRAKDARIARLSREAAEAEALRHQLAEYRELEDEHQELQQQRRKLVTDLQKVNRELENLQVEQQQLVDRQEKAKELNAYNICVKNRQLRWICPDRYVERARRTDQTFIDFEINGSLFAEAGPRNVHVVLTNPAGNVMYPSGEMESDGDQIEFTLSRTVEYANRPLQLSFTVEHPERLESGIYSVEVFIDGRLAGTGDFALE